MSRHCVRPWLCVALLLAALPALAHHTFATFDMNKSLSVSGTVKEFQWTNPHCWIVVLVPNAAGGTDEWRFEGGPPINLSRSGWTEDSLSPGDRITVQYRPRRDGSHGGSFAGITLANGKSLGNGPGAPPAAAK
jgi:hypothetical protein